MACTRVCVSERSLEPSRVVQGTGGTITREHDLTRVKDLSLSECTLRFEVIERWVDGPCGRDIGEGRS